MSVSTITARFISSVALASAMTVAHADVLEIDLGGAAVYSFNDFKSGSGRVDGSILAGRDISLANYSVNTSKNSAYGDYAVVAGRDFTFTGGSVDHGSTYVGGTSYLNQSGTLKGPVITGAAPADLNALATSLTQTSKALAALDATATTEQKWNGIFINGTNSQVEVINLDASWLDTSSWYSFSNLSAGATLIVNFLGDSATFKGGFGAFDGYNVLFNFADATTLNIINGFNANVLAPKATVTGGSGTIYGTVVVNDWNSSVTIGNAVGGGFAAVDVPGLELVATAVPEAQTWAMLLAGMGLMGVVARRRKSA